MKRFYNKPIFFLAIIFAMSHSLRAEETPKTAPPMTPEMEKMMKNMEAAGKVTEHHKALDYLAGKWSTQTKAWHAPNTKPEESAGKATFDSVFGGRFLHETYEGNMMGKPFQGVGYLGYDNIKKKYTTVWIDNMSTGVFMFEGDSSDHGKTITSSGSFMCPLTNEKKTIRSVMKKVGKNEMRYDHYDMDASGKEFKSMEIVYKR